MAVAATSMNNGGRVDPNLWSKLAIAGLFAGGAVFTLLWGSWPQTFISSDPWAYSRIAFDIVDSWDFGEGDHVFQQRLSVTVPTALSYWLLGVGVRSTNLVCLAACLLIIITVWLALPDSRSKLIGVVLCIICVPLFQASLALYPDIVAASFMALSVQMLLLRRKVVFQRARAIAACIPVLAVSSLFVAFLAKLSAYWVVPVWFYAIARDMKRDHRDALFWRFYLPALITGITLGGAYLIFCHLTWGDAFSRLATVEALSGKHLWAWENAGTTVEFIKRLTIGPVVMLIRQYGVVLLALAFLASFMAAESIRPWVYYGMSCLVLYWFGSTSFSRYEPMPLAPRMTLPLLPVLIILAAFLSSRLSVSAVRASWLKLSVPVCFVFLLVGIPFAEHMIEGYRNADLNEARAIRIVQREVQQESGEEVLLLTSDRRSPESLAFYFGYQYPENLRITYVGDLKPGSQIPRRSFVFVERDRSRFLKRAYGLVHYDGDIDALGLVSLYQGGAVSLLQIHDRQQAARLIQAVTLSQGGQPG